MQKFSSWTQQLNEDHTLEQLRLPYKKNALEPSISEETINLHYGKLYKGYVDRFNENKGNPTFNEAGAFLHRVLFEQYKSPAQDNNPKGSSEVLIDSKCGSFNSFKDEFTEQAMKIQGSGWIYLSTDGEINIIHNHEIKHDIALLVDWWEHAFILDYGSDKKKYLENQWKIIDWDCINTRIGNLENTLKD